MKFLNALQEDAGNNFSYLVPMNIVNKGGGWGGDDSLPRGKVSPTPSTLMYASFLYNDQRDLKFLNALQEDTGNNFSYLVPMNIVNSGWGTISNLG